MTIDKITQKLYEGIIKDIPIPAAIVDNSVIISVNPSFPLSSLLGGGAAGINFIDFVLPQHQKTVANYLQSPKGKIEFEMYSGAEAIDEAMIVELSFGVIPGGQVLYLNDITEKRHSKARRLGNILDSCGVVFASYKNNNLVYLNKAAEGLYGVDSGAFISRGRSFSEFVHPDDIEKYNIFMNCIIDDEFKDIEYRIKSPRGIRWVRHKGNIIYSFGGVVRRIDHIITDITSEKKAKEELEKSEEKYRHIFESSNSMMYVVNAEGNFIAINQAGLDLLGLTKEESKTLKIQDFYNFPEERKVFVAKLNEMGEVKDYCTKFKTSSGEVFDAIIYTIAQHNGAPENTRYYGVVSDATKTVYETLRATIRSVRHHLNTKISLISLIADELRDNNKLLNELAEGGINQEQIKKIEELIENNNTTYKELLTAASSMAKITRRFDEVREWKKEEYVLKIPMLKI